ncbi:MULTISPECIES: UDP-2,4-diacetamido-2,4,6-trideoxy-beta-L-altropyranose hydrolase [unclassified Moraxella]|uniref:UDP-2,4-diacetamido-2,4, 6-trideoxy-beta-L-altropyranose hydrolase n=1 Tax=unclassified Moraxella TaxID=2685852 RepID=UPI003AF5D693
MRFVIRADASLQIGSGHIMRCLTLADRLRQQGHTVSFICREHAGHLADFITQKGFDVQLLAKPVPHAFAKNHPHSEWLGVSESDDFAECQPILTALQPDWLVIDHYAIGKTWEQQAKQFLPNVKILAIDDLADREHDCEILLDQNFGRKADDYQNLVPSHCQLLLGTRYTLLREEFSEWREFSLSRRKHLTKSKNILISLGGVDKDNITLKILQSLAKSTQPSFNVTSVNIPVLNVTVVMGKTAPHSQIVQAFAKTAPFPCEVLVNVSNMAELMVNADIAIGASGSTTWERCCLGLPMVLLVLADNQKVIAEALAQQNVVKVVSDIAKLDEQLPSLLNELSENYAKFSRQSAKLVDGHGAKRVANWLEFAKTLQYGKVRQATEDDTQMIWQWRNHVDVRQYMFGQDEIALAEHEKWFAKQLANPNVHLMIFSVNNEPMGFANVTQITLDKYQTLTSTKVKNDEKTATWGFYLSPTSPKGQGLGFALGVLAIAKIFNTAVLYTNGISKITAQVLAYNEPSLALHRKLGFEQTGVLAKHYYVNGEVFDVVEFKLMADKFLF